MLLISTSVEYLMTYGAILLTQFKDTMRVFFGAYNEPEDYREYFGKPMKSIQHYE